MVASFILSQACNVAIWHLSDLQRRPLYGRYQGKSRR
jgi:hypothetical protein